MRLPMSWLREFVDVPVSAGELAERLLNAGLAVEGVERVGQEFEGLLVGRVAAVEVHPRRPDLKVARVDLGPRGTLQAVTGAPNARPGLVTAVAPPGSRPPGLRAEVQVADFAGVRSEAVVLSPREAGIGDDHSGLWELPGELAPGTPLAQALGLADEVLEVDVYPNRADCMSVLGLAREVAAALGLALREPPLEYEEAPQPVEELCDVEVVSFEDCPRYVARVMDRLPSGSSPWWLARRLHLAGMRPIHPVVDVTNYVMLEVGQPLHAFDLERLEGWRVVVRRARPGERLVTLDGRARELDENMLVIADARRPQAVAGIMGGADSEVTERTRAILLEAATFRPALVRRTARRLGVRTEASARFERGLPPALAEWGSRRAAYLLWRMGARVARGSVDRRRPEDEARRLILLRPERVRRVLGVGLAPEEMADYLARVGVEVRPAADRSGSAWAKAEPAAEGSGSAWAEAGPDADRSGLARAEARADAVEWQPAPAAEGPTASGVLECRVPPWRRDLAEEDDLAEEVARLYGYGRIPSTLPRTTARGRWAEETALAFRVRRVLSAAGLFEVLTYSFMHPQELTQLGIPEEHPYRRALRVANPLSDEQSHLRTTLRPGLVRVMRLNVHRRRGAIRIFEVGRIFQADGEEGLPRERLMVGIGLLDVPGAMDRHWYEPPRPADFFDLKGLVEGLAERLRVELEFEAAELAGLHPGRCAIVCAVGADGRRAEVGYAGELHPEVTERLELAGRPLVAELDLQALAAACRGEVRFEPLPRFPAVVRDLALVVPEGMQAREVLRLVREHAGPLARRVQLFDVYTGPGLPAQTRSLGISITYQAPDRTLSDEEVDRARDELVAVLAREGIRLR